jgi:hypothetical protein
MTDPSRDAPRVTTMLVQAWAVAAAVASATAKSAWRGTGGRFIDVPSFETSERGRGSLARIRPLRG